MFTELSRPRQARLKLAATGRKVEDERWATVGATRLESVANPIRRWARRQRSGYGKRWSCMTYGQQLLAC